MTERREYKQLTALEQAEQLLDEALSAYRRVDYAPERRIEVATQLATAYLELEKAKLALQAMAQRMLMNADRERPPVGYK